MSVNSLERVVHRTCLYLTCCRACSLGKPCVQSARLNTQQQLFNLTAAWSGDTSWNKQEADTKTSTTISVMRCLKGLCKAPTHCEGTCVWRDAHMLRRNLRVSVFHFCSSRQRRHHRAVTAEHWVPLPPTWRAPWHLGKTSKETAIYADRKRRSREFNSCTWQGTHTLETPGKLLNTEQQEKQTALTDPKE